MKASLTLVALSLALTACSDDPYSGASTGARSTGEWTYDLAANHHFADRWSEVDEIVLGVLESRQHLTQGWSMPNVKDDGSAPDPLWSDSRSAEITFHLAEVGDREVTFTAKPFLAELQEMTRVRATLNGAPAGEFLIDRQGREVTLELPAADQRVGLNRLAFDFSSQFRPRDVIEGNGDHRNLSVNFDRFRFEIVDPAVAQRAQRRASLVESGSEVNIEGDLAVIDQVSGSSLRYFLVAPPGGVFQADCYYREGDRPVRFVARLLRDGEPDRVLGDVRVAERGTSRPLTASLAEYAGQVVALDLEIVVEAGAGPAVGTWWAPTVTGSEPPLSAERAAAQGAESELEKVRAALKGKSVVTMLLDACNPSYMSCYGGRAGITPNLDRVAEEGVLFENAHAQASFTISSVSSTLSSSYTWEHGAWAPGTKANETVFFWPESFQAAGYRTVAVVHSPNGSDLFGNGRGFEEYYNVWEDVKKIGKSLPTADDVLPYLDAILAKDDERPLFLWLHIIEPHEPYLPPEPFRGKYANKNYEGDVRGDADRLWEIRKFELLPTREEVQSIKHDYESNLNFVDTVFADIRGRLESAGLFDDGVFALFSDHGEGFLEHQGKAHAGMGHGTTVYNEMTRIPLVFRLPEGLGLEGARQTSLVGNFDLLPTMADLVGVPAAPDSISGTSLAPMLVAEDAAVRDRLLSHSASLQSKKFLPILTVWTDRGKYVHSSGEPHELYDLKTDPEEQTNLAPRMPVLTGYLRAQLREEWAPVDIDGGGLNVGSMSTEDLSPEEIEQMRAMGYIGE